MVYMPDYYEFFAPVKIVSGKNALPSITYEMDQLGAKKALIVTDPGVVGAGLINQIESVFEGSGCEIGAIYDKTPPDSSDKVVNEVAKFFKKEECDCLIAVGGGSAIDTAKAANIVITEGTEDLLDYQGVELIKQKLQPFIVIPTTAGTGSEATAAAVITNTAKGIKMSFTSNRLLPDVAIIDPKMTLTVPAKISAATGMDALTHAIEAYYCLQKNPVSDSFSITAIKLIMENLVECVENGSNVDARYRMANAALLAGISFSNSLVGIVHSLAHASGGVAHLPHGLANAIFLPWGIENNIDKKADIIAELAPLMGVAPWGNSKKDAQAVADKVRELNKKLNELCGLPLTLKDAGVKEEQLPDIAKIAINDGTIALNPEEVTYDGALEILKKAF